MSNWVEYVEDTHSKTLEEGSYLCRLEYPDNTVRYTIKKFNIYGNSIKSGYFTSNGRKYRITHFCKFKTLEDE